MYLEYESGTLRVENTAGLRWQILDAPKPAFTFEYDAVSAGDERALRRVGSLLVPLSDAEATEVRSFVERLQPPPSVTFQRQITLELRSFARGLINSAVTQLEYEGLLDVMITAREGSTDLYADEARRVLTYVDSVWNAFHGVAAQIEQTPTAELKTLKQYAQLMPPPPPIDHFTGGILQELLGGSRTGL
jgi:hypothetical protein